MLAQCPLASSSASSSSSSLWSEGTGVSSSPPQASQAAAPAGRDTKTLIHELVPHCRQSFSWDCGLACVQMVLLSFGHRHCDYQLLRQMCATTSIWTVDLAHLIVRFRLPVSFFTVTLGPNPAYANESFYMEHMGEDEQRVSRLFREAGAVGIGLQQRSVGGEELQSWMLSGEVLIIVLVDKRKLDPWLAAADMCLPALCGMELPYAGHYVLLVGFDGHTQEYVVRDPAASVPDLRVSAAALDAARRSFGTDEDILVVGRRAGGGGGVPPLPPPRVQPPPPAAAAAAPAALPLPCRSGGGNGGGEGA